MEIILELFAWRVIKFIFNKMILLFFRSSGHLVSAVITSGGKYGSRVFRKENYTSLGILTWIGLLFIAIWIGSAYP